MVAHQEALSDVEEDEISDSEGEGDDPSYNGGLEIVKLPQVSFNVDQTCHGDANSLSKPSFNARNMKVCIVCLCAEK
jgi:hypothetical protein